MSVSSVISNLQSASNCAGKCNCCASLQQQINQLKQQIQNIKPVDEQAIIKKTEASLFPKIPGLVTPIVLANVNPLKAFQAKQLASQKALLERVFRAEAASRTAQGVASGAAARVGSVASRVAGLAGVLAGVVAFTAALKLSENRFNRVEVTTDRLGGDLSRAFGLIQRNRSGINQNSSKIQSNKNEINQVGDLALGARQEASTANKSANKALSFINNLTKKIANNSSIANVAKNIANTAIQGNKVAFTQAVSAFKKATQAQGTADNAAATANGAVVTANNARSTANNARSTANNAVVTANNTVVTANNAVVTANNARSTANNARSTANNAVVTANNANSTANNALSTAIGAILTAISARTTAGTAQSTAKTATTTATAANSASRLAVRRANNAQSTANTALKTKTKPPITVTVTSGGVVDTGTKNQINTLDKKIDKLTGLFVARAGSIGQQPLTAEQITKASQQGACNALNSPGCNKGITNQIKQGNDQINNRLNTLFGAGNAAANAQQISLLNTINTKLGAQLPGGLAGTFGRLWQTLQVDRVLNILTYISTLHNAMMLSNNIGQTLFGVVDNISQAVGFKWQNEKGNEVGFASIVSQWTTNFFKGLFGEENFNALNANFKKANRIYQAGANIIDSVRSMMDSVRNVSEFIAENTGRIGNALKRYAVIGEDAFKWMPEKVDGRSIWLQRLENIEEAASGIEMITGEVLSITQNVNEIQEQAQKFKNSISNSPIQEQTQNTAVNSRESTNKTQSQSPVIPESAERNP